MKGHKTRDVFDHYPHRQAARPGAGRSEALGRARRVHTAGHNSGTVTALRDPVDIAAARK
jgi:hypothetical protein